MNSDSLLFRQVHPAFIQAGQVTSQVFRPTPKDEEKLSAYNGELISAENSYNHYVNNLELQSSGVLGVSKEQCEYNGLAVDEDGIPFVEHCSIVFKYLSKSQIERKAKILKRFALDRGWLFRPEQVQ